MPDSVQRHLRPVTQVQLRNQAAHMVFHRAFGYKKVLGDFPV